MRPLCLTLSLPVAAPAWADPSGDQGQPNADEGKTLPSGPVGTVSVFAHTLNDAGSSLGQHSSGFAPGQDTDKDGAGTGRVGMGNLARNDAGLSTDPNSPFKSGDDPNSHFAGQIAQMCGCDPATLAPADPNRGNTNG